MNLQMAGNIHGEYECFNFTVCWIPKFDCVTPQPPDIRERPTCVRATKPRAMERIKERHVLIFYVLLSLEVLQIVPNYWETCWVVILSVVLCPSSGPKLDYFEGGD